MKNLIIFVCCIILFAACNLHKDNENDYDNVPALPLEKGKYQIIDLDNAKKTADFFFVKNHISK